MIMENQDENEVVEEEFTPEESEETEEVEADTTDWKAKADELQGRLKRAETKLSKNSSNKPESKPSKSNELDYGAKAYLTANGVKGAKEFEFVEQELKKSGDDLDTLLENDYFKQRLENFRGLNKTSEATIAGKRSGGAAIDSVDYWSTKPIEEVPLEMRSKVVNAKRAKEATKGVFYNS